MSDFIEIGSYIIRVDEIVLLNFRVEEDTYSISYKCYIDILLANGVELEVKANCHRKERFEEIKALINQELAVRDKSIAESSKPQRFKTVITNTVTQRKRR